MQQTPPDRDRYADLLRVVSIVLVVLGHWLAAVVLVRGRELVTGRVHALVPWTQWGTWVFQVMPVFFIVGGFVNARSWSQARLRASEQGALRRGKRDEHSWAAWTQRRFQRLTIPLFPLIGFWVPLVPVLLAAGLPRDSVQLASRVAFAPIWFLGVYLLVIALVPLTWALHRRFAWKAVIGFVVAAVVVDMLVRAGIRAAGPANLFFVWAGVHQVGYFWQDRRLPNRPMVGGVWAVVGMGTLLALVTVGGYPVSMVAVGDGAPSNVTPPSVALFTLALAQLGIVIAARPVLSRWLERPRVWAVVVTVGSITLTVYLWHMTALILAAALTYVTGLWPHRSEIDALWWKLRPLWLMLCALLLAMLVFFFRRFEQAVPVPRAAPVRTLIGLGTTLAGITWLVQRGLYVPETPWQISLVGIGVLFGGLALLGALRPRPPPAERG